MADTQYFHGDDVYILHPNHGRVVSAEVISTDDDEYTVKVKTYSGLGGSYAIYDIEEDYVLPVNEVSEKLYNKAKQ